MSGFPDAARGSYGFASSRIASVRTHTKEMLAKVLPHVFMILNDAI